ncbi:hypothetical protein F4V43_08800 [Paenibacillus spiritus]|uniref:Spore coat protein n=1 Tax=Paenibacillus spiritus TaxID=2496557 RepID=A0A5J5GAL5_9BACL|nr:hypothetical protein [Paenibacillus spiritus]KAA9005157.1 hypothetical protein F4V43_08800 [Paenibacillus spiritus]
MKIAGRVLTVCLIAVLASTLSILTAGVVVNAYVRSALSSLDIELDTPAPGIGGLLRTLAGAEPKPAAKKDTAAGKTSASGADSIFPAAAASPSPAGAGADTVPAATADAEGAPADALPVMGAVNADTGEASGAADGEGSGASGQAEPGSAGSGDRQLVMTPENLQEMKSGIPSGEKVSIFNILMKKVPQAEMQRISAAMEGGLTAAELEQIQTVIRKYVTAEEYDQLMKLISSSTDGGYSGGS